MISGLAIREETGNFKYFFKGKEYEFTKDELDELVTLRGEFNATGYFGNPLCVYRDINGELHRLCTE